ncbi:hypothetical protein PULV_a0008 [Pseudoalteromonas ulvae UL12]|nr:hypothetical protein [Pseudoalteromonas ulvae UL12]
MVFIVIAYSYIDLRQTESTSHYTVIKKRLILMAQAYLSIR